jgi:hypothetical protein
MTKSGLQAVCLIMQETSWRLKITYHDGQSSITKGLGRSFAPPSFGSDMAQMSPHDINADGL